MTKKTYRTWEAAIYTGYSRHTLAKLRCVGGGPKFFKIANRRLIGYTQEALDEWLAVRERTSTSKTQKTVGTRQMNDQSQKNN